MNVRFTSAARDDIARIHDYIFQHNPVAAARVFRAIEVSTYRLADFPNSGRIGGVADTVRWLCPTIKLAHISKVIR